MKNNFWYKFAPWFLTFSCSITLIIIGLFLIYNIEWFKESVFSNDIIEIRNPEYRFYAYHMHLSMIKRSVGLFSGFAIMFLGLGVALFSLNNDTTLEAEGLGVKANIVTASPGIIALLIGAYLVISTIQSKDEFKLYENNSQTNKILNRANKPNPPSDLGI